MCHHIKSTKGAENQVDCNDGLEASHACQNFQVKTDKTKNKCREGKYHSGMDSKRTDPHNECINGIGHQEPPKIAFSYFEVSGYPGIFCQLKI